MVTVNADGTILLRSLNPVYEPLPCVGANDVLEIWRFYAYTSREMPEARSEMAKVLKAIKDLEEKVRQMKK
jgi:hypothetical protein